MGVFETGGFAGDFWTPRDGLDLGAFAAGATGDDFLPVTAFEGRRLGLESEGADPVSVLAPDFFWKLVGGSVGFAVLGLLAVSIRWLTNSSLIALKSLISEVQSW